MNLSTCVLLSLQVVGQCRRKITKLYSLVPLQSPGFQPELGFQNYFINLLFVPRQFPFSFSTLLNSLLTTYSYPSFSALNLASLSLSFFFPQRSWRPQTGIPITAPLSEPNYNISETFLSSTDGLLQDLIVPVTMSFFSIFHFPTDCQHASAALI